MSKEDILNMPIRIEEKEKEILIKFGWIFKNSLNEFSTSIDWSLGYLDKIILPTIYTHFINVCHSRVFYGCLNSIFKIFP